MINVVNKHTYAGSNGHYIGRPSVLGNPYDLMKYGREGCVALYKLWLQGKMKEDTTQLRELLVILGKHKAGTVDLVCYCAPLECHGDIVKKAVEWLMEQGI